MFTLQLHDRAAAQKSVDEQAWMFIHSDDTQSQAANGSLDLDVSSTTMQLGFNVFSDETAAGGDYQLGVMAGIGESRSHADADGNTHSATGKVNGYSLGSYVTWHQDTQAQLGWYIDSWARYSWYNNSVQGENMASENYHSQGLQTSVETGYLATLGKLGQRQWTLEPQVQAIYSRFDSEDHTEANGSRITGGSDEGIQSRVGLRLSNRHIVDKGAMVPWVEVNWENGQYSDSLVFNGDTVSSDVPENRYGIQAGLSGELSSHVRMWGQAGAMLGDNDFTRYQASVGVNIDF